MKSPYMGFLLSTKNSTEYFVWIELVKPHNCPMSPDIMLDSLFTDKMTEVQKNKVIQISTTSKCHLSSWLVPSPPQAHVPIRLCLNGPVLRSPDSLTALSHDVWASMKGDKRRDLDYSHPAARGIVLVRAIAKSDQGLQGHTGQC